MEAHTKYGLRARVMHRRSAQAGGQQQFIIGGVEHREAVVAAGLNPRALSKPERSVFGGRGNEYISVRCGRLAGGPGRIRCSECTRRGAHAPRPGRCWRQARVWLQMPRR